MARRSDHSRDELYRLATVAARKIVETRGIEALTARSVADAIGYSPGTLYNVFDNFEALIVRLNGSTLDKLHDELSAILRTGRPAQDLRALLAAYLGFQEAHPNLWDGPIWVFAGTWPSPPRLVHSKGRTRSGFGRSSPGAPVRSGRERRSRQCRKDPLGKCARNLFAVSHWQTADGHDAVARRDDRNIDGLLRLLARDGECRAAGQVHFSATVRGIER